MGRPKLFSDEELLAKSRDRLRRHRAENPEYWRLLKKKYSALHSDLYKQKCKDWRKANPEKDRASRRRLQLLCPTCNSIKRDMDPLDWAARLGKLFV